MEKVREQIEKLMEKLKIKKLTFDQLLIGLLAGIFLLVIAIPMGKEEGETEESTLENAGTQSGQNITVTGAQADENQEYIAFLEARLTEALSKVEGIGKVEVMITLKSSREMVINKDTPYEQTVTNEVDSEGGTRESTSIKQEEETILIEEDGNSVPYVLKEIEPEIAGIVIVAEGGDNSVLANEITEAVEVLFSVPAHKVKVLKMES